MNSTHEALRIRKQYSMTSQQLDEERIFHIARVITDAGLRSEYLEQICAGDASLRDRVEALLDVHEQEKSFLRSENGLAATVELTQITEGPGQRIGRFKLLQKIGEGGFGVVYMAEQERPVRRKVALKIIKPGMDTHAVIARFEAERQTLALMDHTNIARVFDGGETESNRPYFVMELVQGIAITEYCDKNQLSTEDRLRLIITVCQAVQHAHQKGIIHRDLKPSNVLVTLADGQPIVKVIDFGVAKAINQQLTEKTLFTAYGQMVGTPQYMSPEQAEMSCLDIDTRSDVYSLGVLLYELLTGTTPLETERLRKAGFAEMQRLIREEEPQKPSTRVSTSGKQLTAIAKHRSVSPNKLKSQIKGDLDWIVLKALEKDRNRRYESPLALARDIGNQLNDQPIIAGPPSLVDSSRRYLRRRWKELAVALVILIFAGYSWHQALKSQQLVHKYQEAFVGHAKEAIFNADFETAAELLKDVDNEQVTLVRTLRGISHFYTGNYSESLSELTQAVTADPKDVSALAMLSVVEHLLGHYMDANEHRREAFETMTPRADNVYLDSLCLAQTQILDDRAEETEDVLQRLYADEKKPLVSVVLAHALAHRAFEWDYRKKEELESVRDCIAQAKGLIKSSKEVTQGFHILDTVDLFVRLMEMHVLKCQEDPQWRSGTEEADKVADRLVSRVQCPTSLMMAAEYYRLTKGAGAVERIYRKLADFEGSKFKLACMRALLGMSK